MSDEKKSSKKKSSFIYNLILLVPNIFHLIKNITRIIKRDAYLAGKNIVLIIILTIMLACLLTSTWFGVLAIIFLCLVKLQLGLLSSAIIVLLLNILLIIFILKGISKAKQHILFRETQRQVSRHLDL